MTYTPTAYTREINQRWWICMVTPSGLTARIVTTYQSKADAERAISIFGFRLVDTPAADVFVVRASLSPT